jgi:hypothetical protein
MGNYERPAVPTVGEVGKRGRGAVSVIMVINRGGP